jgi:hypothetical protein
VQSRRKRAEPQVQAQVVELRADRLIGSLVGFVSSYQRGEVRVDFPGNERGPLAARVSTALDGPALESAAATQQDALLIFEGGDPGRPILMSLLRSATPMVDLLLGQPHQLAPDHVRVDGERVSIEGKEEVVLRCGKASLTLRRDGKVLLRGVNVVSQADQVHKVRGGKVQIN